MDNNTEQDLQNYQTLLTLWQAENPIKTIKLQFLLATNGMLFGFYSISTNDATVLAVCGLALNIIWTLSIGRTSLFQKAWKVKLDHIAKQHPDDARFQILDRTLSQDQAPHWLRFLGGISSKYYLLATPLGMAAAWLIITVISP